MIEFSNTINKQIVLEWWISRGLYGADQKMATVSHFLYVLNLLQTTSAKLMRYMQV